MKHRNKAVGAARPSNPTFLYTSVCCDAPAEKDPCVRSAEDKQENVFSKSTLGGWTCGRCKRPAKVNRTRNKQTPQVPA
jgi:hypothetical protein